MSKKKDQERDIGWDHGEMLSARHHWRCKWCNIEFKEGGVTRLKQHLAGGYPDVSMCRCVDGRDARGEMHEARGGVKDV